jgi:hypothetical protein
MHGTRRQRALGKKNRSRARQPRSPAGTNQKWRTLNSSRILHHAIIIFEETFEFP